MNTVKIYHKKYIAANEVVLLKAEANYTVLHFENGNKIILAKTLKRLHECFSEHGFFRISKTNMVNLKFIAKTNENYAVVKMKNDLELHVSRRRRLDLKDFIFSNTKSKILS
ncbi:MAG: LytTR family transcriptional regulator DNA-binding domain-containing protein [Emticicia sp.]|uniref:LytTR family transcriptional regulator DNA-binding domain-containing protein n=1 Tax=Emticicia sp. TaxID=1930953 RepID=UPI003BA67A15